MAEDLLTNVESKDPVALQSDRPEAAGDNRGQSPLKKEKVRQPALWHYYGVDNLFDNLFGGDVLRLGFIG